MSGESSPFEDIHLGWAGERYTIPAGRVMGAIKRIEDHVTLAELQRDSFAGKLRLAKISAAFADVLRYAGAKDVSEDDVYAGMFGAEAQANVVGAVSSLLGMMIPTNVRLGVETAAKGGGAGEARPRTRKAAARSSKRRSN